VAGFYIGAMLRLWPLALIVVALALPDTAAACHPVADPPPPGYRDHGCGDSKEGTPGAKAPPAASAADPGRWLLTGATYLPIRYWQGLTADPSGRRVFFAGTTEGLWRTTPRLRQTAGKASAIPPQVKSAEGYNHIGDPSWDAAEGGRVLLPLECYTPGTGDTNPCDTGSLGVADPATLAWRYYVKLDPAEIPKAMWAEVSPDGSQVWTSSGADLLAYSAGDVSAANAAPAGAPIRSVGRLPGAVPPSGITGAVFRAGRLLLAGDDTGPFQIWSIDPATGARELEVERRICGESEGLHVMRTLGGALHWLIAPVAIGCPRATFGPDSALLHFTPRSGAHALRVFARVRRVRRASAAAGRRVSVGVRVKGLRGPRPVAGVRVSLAGYSARTNRHGHAVITGRFYRSGRYGVLARKGTRFGLSGFVRVNAAR
jgi:hypothetical protein